MPARKKTATTATVSKSVTKKPTTRKRVAKTESFESTESSASEISSSSSNRSLPRVSKKNLYLVAIVIGLLLLGYLASKYLVIAWVDKKPITRFEFYSLLEKRHGEEAKEELIVEKLLLSEGQQKGISVNQKEVNDEIKKLEDQVGGPDKLDQFIKQNNLTREDFLRVTKIRLLIQRIFGKNVNVSDDELNKYIEANKESILPPAEEGSPAAKIDDKMKQSIKDSLTQQKVNEAFNKWLEETQKSSRVVKM